jgi:5-methylcytosine-specific restriction endonuclease McrA
MPVGRSSIVRRRWRMDMMVMQAARCHWCKGLMQTGDPQSGNYASFEHLHRRRHGGKFNRRNLVLACKQCNNERN